MYTANTHTHTQAARQFLLLSHLYSRTDSASLAAIRRQLLPPWATPAQVCVRVCACVCLIVYVLFEKNL